MTCAVTLDRDRFVRAVRAVQHAIGDKTRPEAQQCLLVRVVDSHWVDFVCSDGHRIARWRERVIAGDTYGSALVRNVEALTKWARGLTRGGEVLIDFDARVVHAACSDPLTLDVSTDDFPAYDAMLECVAKQDRSDIARRLRALAKAIDDETTVDHVRLLRDAAHAIDKASTVTLNGRYLSEAAKAFGRSESYASLAGKLDPVVFRTTESDVDLVCFVMPMRM